MVDWKDIFTCKSIYMQFCYGLGWKLIFFYFTQVHICTPVLDVCPGQMNSLQWDKVHGLTLHAYVPKLSYDVWKLPLKFLLVLTRKILSVKHGESSIQVLRGARFLVLKKQAHAQKSKWPVQYLLCPAYACGRLRRLCKILKKAIGTF